MRKVVLLSLLSVFLIAAPFLSYSQTITTTSNSATISLPSSFSNDITVTVFYDTVIFEENFDKFLGENINSSAPIASVGFLATLPRSLTQIPNCRAQNIKIESDSCLLSGVFATPTMYIPADSKLTFTLRTRAESIVKINNDTIVRKKGTHNIEYSFVSAETGLQISKKDNDVYIDNIKITSPRQELLSASYSIANGNLVVNNLLPDSRYYIEVKENQTNETKIYFAATKKRVEGMDFQLASANSVNLFWNNNDDATAKTLYLYKVSNATDDLLISRIATGSSRFGLEIFNGTEKDICLENYKLVFFAQCCQDGAYNSDYIFSDKDTIHSNSSILINYSLGELSSYDNLCFPMSYSNSIAGGNDACMLAKRGVSGDYDNIVDMFRYVLSSVSNSKARYMTTILTRKGNVVTGVKENPDSDIPYFKSQDSEWDSVPYNSTNLNSDETKHKLASPISYTLVETVPLGAADSTVALENLDTRAKYRAVIMEGDDTIAMLGFSTGNIVKTQTSGDWSNSATWEGGSLPEYCDKVIVGKGHKLSVPEGKSASCAELVLQSDYSVADYNTQKAELDLKGALTVGKTTVEASFKKYTVAENTDNASADGWHFFGVPIDVTKASRNEIGKMFDRGWNDDLYYLNEQMYAWIPYLEEVNEENFFTNRHGYLVAYEADKTLSFSGELYLEDSIVLLADASLTSGKGEGYHLVCNPYPFSVNLNHFKKNNVTGFWLLNPTTGQYIPSDNNEPVSLTIPPFMGIMTQVSSPTNSLVLYKESLTQAVPAKASQDVQSVKFNLSYEGGNDQMRIYFREGASLEYDDYDTYKMFSLGTAPDLSCWFNDMDLSIISLPNSIDSVRLQVEITNKTAADLTLQMYEMTEGFEQVGLYVQGSDSLICDFTKDSLCTLPLTLEKKKTTLDLVLSKRRFAELNGRVDKIVLSQDNRKITVLQPEQAEEIILTDVQGRQVVKSEGNIIELPFSGCFLIRVKSGSSYYSTKVMAL